MHARALHGQEPPCVRAEPHRIARAHRRPRRPSLLDRQALPTPLVPPLGVHRAALDGQAIAGVRPKVDRVACAHGAVAVLLDDPRLPCSLLRPLGVDHWALRRQRWAVWSGPPWCPPSRAASSLSAPGPLWSTARPPHRRGPAGSLPRLWSAAPLWTPRSSRSRLPFFPVAPYLPVCSGRRHPPRRPPPRARPLFLHAAKSPGPQWCSPLPPEPPCSPGCYGRRLAPAHHPRELASPLRRASSPVPLWKPGSPPESMNHSGPDSPW
mmetsp:Transcript_113067/g.324995  ORF Transcript_113067/g.324995 Transcript_113067/m.324995 type:complete len:266 (-) Transcript_113067:740-1537(-)